MALLAQGCVEVVGRMGLAAICGLGVRVGRDARVPCQPGIPPLSPGTITGLHQIAGGGIGRGKGVRREEEGKGEGSIQC